MILKRRTKRGKLRYAVRVDRGGRQEWVGTFNTLAEARHREAKARAEGRSPTRMSCDRWAEFWLEGYRGRVKRSSYMAAEAALKKFSQDFRGIPLTRVERVAAQKWARANRWQVPVVVTLLNAAVEAELLNRNPFAGLSRKGEGRKRIMPLTAEEVDGLALAALEVHGPFGPTMRSLTLFLAYTALRPGEIFPLEWSDLDFDQMRIRVERRDYKGEIDLPKSNRRRLAVLTPPARDALLTLPGREGLVFTGKRGGGLSQSLLSWYWQPVAARARRKVTPYELRHFAAHYLYVILGLPARVVAAQLGHDGPKLIEQLYGHGDVGALEEIDRAFASNVIPLKRAGVSSTGSSTGPSGGTN